MPKFVVHKHSARTLHCDLRLELDGTVKSWAVPKGPPETPGVKRLAVAVDDHAFDCLDFEGTIQKDNTAPEKSKSGTKEHSSWTNERKNRSP